MKRSTLLAIITVALFASCKKDNAPAPDSKSATDVTEKNQALLTADVYITGMIRLTDTSEFVQPAYWKNGTVHMIPHKGDAEALAITASGNNVYLAGHDVGPSGTLQPCYWVNGTEHFLPVPNGFTGNACGIAVQGNNIYVVGSYLTRDDNETGRAMLWKNGVGTVLAFNKEDSQATGIALDGNDVYISGNATFNGTSCAVYWKNEVWHPFAGTTDNSQATGIAVDALHNFYVSGSNPTGNGYWKKTTFKALSNAAGVPSSIVVNKNNDVYVGGQMGDSPAYWKDGQVSPLTIASSTSGGVQAIAVSGADVYTAVFYFVTPTGSGYSYYKNSKVVKNLTNAASVFSMTVVPPLLSF